MFDNSASHEHRLKGQPHLAGKVSASGPRPPEGGEGACAAFGYLRGLHERASAIEFRLKNGNGVWFPYAWLGNWKFDPSAGLLLKFSGDLIYLVLIRGSNLDRRLQEGGIDLIRAGTTAAPRALGAGDERGRDRPDRGERPGRRQHRNRRIRVARGAQGMACTKTPPHS